MEYSDLIKETANKGLVRIVLSKPVKPMEVSKVRIRPVLIKNSLKYQITRTIGTKENNTYKEVHENLTDKELEAYLCKAVPGEFLQALIEHEKGGFTVLATKKGTITVLKNKTVSAKTEPMDHNRTKKYLLPEGEPVPFLRDLGVMTADGNIVKAKYDKFRQINRYLEFVENVVGSLKTDRELTIIDFGCGKSYLTFALYYYLNVRKKLNARIIGLDLKTDVIKNCSALARKYGYSGLTFIEGDIEHFEGIDHVDMVMTLHACDTATDYAIAKAIKWNADVIMAVPCCQHELNKKLSCDELEGITEYGLLKDRMSAIITDAMRANIMKSAGYDTQILEFIDMEHTPKNLLIRGVKSSHMRHMTEASAEDKLEKLIGTDILLKRLVKEI